MRVFYQSWQPWLVVVAMVFATTFVGVAEEAVVPTVAQAEPSAGDLEQAVPDWVTQWEQMGQLFFQVVDERVTTALERNADYLIQQKVDAAMATFEARLAKLDTSVTTSIDQFRQDLEELRKSLAELQNLVLAHDAQISDLDLKLIQLIEELKKEISSSDVGIQNQLQQSSQEIAKLQATTKSLNTRLWVTTAAAVLSVVLALVIK